VTQEEERLRQESLFHLKTTHFDAMSVDFKEKMDALSRKAGQEVSFFFKFKFLIRIPNFNLLKTSTRSVVIFFLDNIIFWNYFQRKFEEKDRNI
jgi:hypothetical protein